MGKRKVTITTYFTHPRSGEVETYSQQVNAWPSATADATVSNILSNGLSLKDPDTRVEWHIPPSAIRGVELVPPPRNPASTAA
ncbi:MAG: hypothetical protein GWN58_11170 [Anaerolineae bacterium]|nr:hypothetical protein [Anaerolineae bacterium]